MALLFRGYNTSEPNDYRLFRPSTNELSFARLFWESSDSTFVVNPRLSDELPETGLPRSLPVPGTFARTTCGTSSKEVGGWWVLAWDGAGECGVRNGANTQRNTGRYIRFDRDASTNVDVCIYSTSGTDPVRNLWLGEERYYANRATVFIKPEWAAMLRGLNATHPRFMQLQNTNTSTVTSWDGRRPDDYFTQSDIIADDSSWGRGASLGFLLTIAVETNADSIWLCVPHAVDEGSAYVQYVHQALLYIRDWRHPATGARFTGAIRVQYSNESWNSGLGPQHTYCQARGVALGVDGSSPFEQGHQFYAIRSEQIFQTAVAARMSVGLANPIIRVLDEQAGVGEYLFRYRTQVNPRSATPRNVEADEFTSACYYGHPNFERGDFYTLTGVSGTFQAGEVVTNGLAGGNLREATFRFTESGQHFVELNREPWLTFGDGQTMTGLTSGASGTIASKLENRIGRIQIGGDFNPWLTPSEFVALTDTQIGEMCQRDLDQRVFREVTTYSEGSFPSAPILRMGGILATMQYAGVSRGLRVTSYEGGCDHINLPSASEDNARWTAARDRNVVWHRSTIAGALHEQCIRRHVEAGVEGIWLFDDGTGWNGAYGCWSIYEDHRRLTGFAEEQRYLATQRAFAGGGPPQINAQYTSSIVSTRANPGTVTIVSLGLSRDATAARVVTRGEPATVSVSSDFNRQATRARFRSIAYRGDVTIGNIPPIEVLSTTSRFRSIGIGATVTLINRIVATSYASRVYTCMSGATVTLRDRPSNGAIASAANVRTRAYDAIGTLRGGDGVATGPVPRVYAASLAFLPQVSGVLPAGTNVWRGQAMGWVPELGILRPLRPGDLFAGFAAENVSGYEIASNGDQVLSRKQLRCKIHQKGTVAVGLGDVVTIAQDVFFSDDVDTTLTDNGSRAGRVIAARGAYALVYFEGVPLRVGERS